MYHNTHVTSIASCGRVLGQFFCLPGVFANLQNQNHYNTTTIYSLYCPVKIIVLNLFEWSCYVFMLFKSEISK